MHLATRRKPLLNPASRCIADKDPLIHIGDATQQRKATSGSGIGFPPGHTIVRIDEKLLSSCFEICRPDRGPPVHDPREDQSVSIGPHPVERVVDLRHRRPTNGWNDLQRLGTPGQNRDNHRSRIR